LERTYHPDRVLTPLKRVGPKGSGRFERTTWQRALDDIASGWPHRGARSRADRAVQLCRHDGAGAGRAMAQRLFNRLGASRLDRTICASAGSEALTYTLARAGHRPRADPEQSADRFSGAPIR